MTVRAIAGETDMPWLEPFSFTGWSEVIQSMRTHRPNDSLTSRARLRLELEADFGAFYGFVSADAEKNWQINDETGVDLQEAWLEYAANRWDLRIGRQIVIWGRADGVQITDIVSPPDYTESITRDLDEIRMPVDAAKFRLLGDFVNTELIWIPVFEPAVQPSGDNPWAVATDLPENVHVTMADAVEPDTSLENGEIALKVAAYLSGLDVAASVFYTWDETINLWFRGVAEIILRFRWANLIVYVLLMAAAIMGIGRIETEVDMDNWFLEDDALLAAKDRFEEIFGNDDFCAILVEADNVFTTQVLTKIRELGHELVKKVPYADDVVSPTDFEYTYGTEEGMQIIDLVPDPLPTDKAALEKIKTMALAKPSMKNRIVSADGTQTWIMLRMKPIPDEWDKDTEENPESAWWGSPASRSPSTFGALLVSRCPMSTASTISASPRWVPCIPTTWLSSSLNPVPPRSRRI
ncbi:hypothetical protein DSCO28_31260 [Desulfosarcina ovata subsp. sediminis]|uniref:Uncharacterized protein n=1 Tax=Desulfosarcina ovata subsp. sediminis TaxID=885957 RepID=A0A5K7ZQZ6_9BACT|nr:DUF1302 family protein [Desulfosarcina ovata]BBO82560.1 hypothetical protein DSCO28_31260 [Desulfosarcina ovata subsp. sediminis]